MGSVPDTIAFKHPFFKAIGGAIFTRDDADSSAIMRFPLDDVSADLHFPGIKRELKLDPTASDAVMLDFVEKALNFVPTLKVGDPIPAELHSGAASWSIAAKHRTIAKARISMQLVSWMSGDEAVLNDAAQLAMIADDPAMKAKVNDAFKKAARQLGLADDQRDEVVNLVDQFAEELAYIEALRDQLEHIAIVEARIEKMAEIFRGDRSVMDNINQVRKLCAVPMAQYRATLEEIDAQTGEIIAVLKNIDSQIKYVRAARDDLHQRFWAWNALVERWTETPAKHSQACERLIMDTYQFLARRFLPQSEWELFTKAQENSEKKTESVW